MGATTDTCSWERGEVGGRCECNQTSTPRTRGRCLRRLESSGRGVIIALVLLLTATQSRAGIITDLSARPGVRSVQLDWRCEEPCGAQILQYYDADTRISPNTTPMSTITGERSYLIERLAPNTNYTLEVYDELSPEFKSVVTVTTLAVQLEKLRCAPHQIELTIYTGPVFGGIIYVGGHYDVCNLIGTANRETDLYTFIIPIAQCANKLPNHHYETTVVVQEHLSISTGHDLAMSISCDYTPPKEKTVTSGVFDVTDDPTNEVVSEEDRRKYILQPRAHREQALAANLRQQEIDESIESERVEDEVVLYNLAAIGSITLGVCFMLTAAGIWYCRHKQLHREQRKQLDTEQCDPRRAVMLFGAPSVSTISSPTPSTSSCQPSTSQTTDA